MNIMIPERLNKLLDQSELGNPVRLSLQHFEQWLEGSTGGLFFFPEYTDHGPKHVSAVLGAAEALIRPEAWEHLTTEDATVLVLAALLHDYAMHLTADGFLHLIEPHEIPDHPRLTLDEKTWPQLFDQFYLEARRWDQRTLHSLLGDQATAVEEEEDLAVYIRHPREKPNSEDWSVRYRKFLGEFVRRHHARLAHEIALKGFPGATPGHLRLTGVPENLADLAGLVARSHNMHLRDTFPYLRDKHYGRVNCAGSHPVFLMALLRIADYLEFRADRVNPTRLRIQRLRSPVSQEEWNSHLAVHEVRPDDEDKEAVFVIAKPPTASTFFKIKRLLSGLQTELDTSWAVLGEVFSKQGELSQLGLTLRRVRSNLDDLEQFIKAERLPYIPIRAAFDTAGVDLLKLLIKPLYGDRPEIGVRELLQNALDAVHELRQWAAERGDPEVRSVPRPDQNADVEISINQHGPKGSWLTISDKGIGMTAETVRDYFLRAGASYRQSEVWRRSFEEEGRSKVLRSGRFGVGALAAFLLGNRIEVITRHVSNTSNKGLRFSASIEDQVVELRWEKREYVGTTIRVKLTKQALKVLRNVTAQADWAHVDSLRRRHPWDWYVLDDPKVERYSAGGKLLAQQYHLPSPCTKPLPSDWRSVAVEGYQMISWTYSDAPALACNGIRIESYRHESQRKAQRKKLLPGFAIIKRPAVSIFDRDGRLPLNLQRSEIEAGELPFSAELLKDVLSDLYAFLLVHGPHDPTSAERWIISRPMPFEPLTHYKSLEIEQFWLTQEGMALTHPWHLQKGVLRQGLLVLSGGLRRSRMPSKLTIPPDGVGVFFGISHYFGFAAHAFNTLQDLGVSGYRSFTPDHWQGDQPGRKRTREHSIKEYGEVPHDQPDLLTLELGKALGNFALMELYFDPSRLKIAKSPVTEILDDLVETPIIPFNTEDRRRKLARSFERLRDYVGVWQSENLEGWRKVMVQEIQQASQSEQPHNPRQPNLFASDP